MMQQVNLYQASFKKQHKPLAASHMIVISVLAIIGLCVFHFFNVQSLRPIQTSLDDSRIEYDELTAEVTNMESLLKPIPVDKLLQKEINQLSSRLQLSKEILAALTEGPLSNTSGFSAYFEAIAKRHVNGTWITGISIAGGGNKFGFKGKTVQAELVPVYIRKLSDEDIFDDFRFNVLELERIDKKTSIIDFNVATGNG